MRGRGGYLMRLMPSWAMTTSSVAMSLLLALSWGPETFVGQPEQRVQLIAHEALEPRREALRLDLRPGGERLVQLLPCVLQGRPGLYELAGEIRRRQARARGVDLL